jgi:hypothetical protein
VTEDAGDLELRRVLRYLRNGSATVSEASDPELLLLRGEGRAAIGAKKPVIAALLRSRRIHRQGTSLALPENNAPAGGARRFEAEQRETPFGFTEVAVNLEESPLAQLRRMRNRDHQEFLTAAEWRSGERLRVDFTRGQIMPRLGANWETTVASGRRSNGIADLTDAALAARLRVNRAIEAVGPELSGLLLDICCFLKGLEQVEAERGLPRRSAKVLLKTGLGILARHYEPGRSQPAKPLHWGAGDYRPTLAGAS